VSAFHGPQGKGAMRRHREQKRLEAEERNAGTPVERRRAYREGTSEERLLMNIFGEKWQEAS
jgi:hypothetical protein